MTAAQTALDVAALIDAIALKMQVELGAELTRSPGAVAIRYPAPLHHPWPREVDVSVDVMATDLAASAAASATIGEPHRAHVFGCDLVAAAAAVAAAGYDPCWNTQTLAIKLASTPASGPDGLELERVGGDDQIAELNALEPDFRSYRESLGRAEFFDLLGRRGGRAIAKGQLVCASPHAAYVADMFTAPDARNTGCAGALLSALHTEAQRRGIARAVLIPSLAAAESGFYVKRGYARISIDAVLLSKT